jgi:hydroxymethylglutaryl-CoA synthase
MFAFGGGCAASMYALRIVQSPENIVRQMDLLRRLSAMKLTSVQEYISAMEVR